MKAGAPEEAPASSHLAQAARQFCGVGGDFNWGHSLTPEANFAEILSMCIVLSGCAKHFRYVFLMLSSCHPHNAAGEDGS